MHGGTTARSPDHSSQPGHRSQSRTRIHSRVRHVHMHGRTTARSPDHSSQSGPQFAVRPQLAVLPDNNLRAIRLLIGICSLWRAFNSTHCWRRFCHSPRTRHRMGISHRRHSQKEKTGVPRSFAKLNNKCLFAVCPFICPVRSILERPLVCSIFIVLEMRPE